MYTGKISENEAITQIENKHNHTIKYIEGFINMRTKCMWKCKNCNNEMYVTPSSLKAGHGCSKCAHKKIAKKNELPVNKIIERIAELYGKELILDDATYVNTTTKCRFICSKHGDRWMKPYSVLNGKGCLLCANEINLISTEERQRQLKEKFGDRITLDKNTYKNSFTKSIFICNIHKNFESTFRRVISSKYGCPKCAKENNMVKVKEIKKRLMNKYEDNIQLDETTYKNTYTKARFICKKHEGFWAVPSDVLNQTYGCRKCADIFNSINQILPINKVNEKLKQKYGDKITIDATTYKSVHEDAKFICKKHNYFWAKVYNVFNGVNCPMCSRMSLENPIIEALEKHNIKYKHNKGLKDCIYNKKPLRPDFYIETKNGILWIEADGKQHQLPIYGEKELEETQKRDKYKDNYCKEKGICIIRITSKPEWGTIKHIVVDDCVNLIDKGDLGNGELDINIFKPFDFNRTI